MSLGQNISILRKLRGLTQEKLAKRARISTPERISISGAHISMIENGIRYPSFPVLEALAKALGTTVSELSSSRQIHGEIILNEAEQRVADFIIRTTKEGPVRDWTERIANIARRAHFPLEKINWQGSPESVATNVVAFAVYAGEFNNLKRILAQPAA